VQLISGSAKKADLKRGTELAGVPAVFKTTDQPGNVATMNGRQFNAEIRRIEKEMDAEEKALARDRDRNTAELIALANMGASERRAADARELAERREAAKNNMTRIGNEYANWRDREKLRAALEKEKQEKRRKPPKITLQAAPADEIPEFLRGYTLDINTMTLLDPPNEITLDAKKAGAFSSIIVAQERTADGRIIGIDPNGTRYARQLDGSYVREDSG
jgi:hypothetical protein